MNTANDKLACVNEIIQFEENSIDALYIYNNPDEYDLAKQCLQRSLLCLKSCVYLIQSSYIGSANALLRQIYEFLVWAKASVDTKIERSKEISDRFFRSVKEQDPSLGELISSLFTTFTYKGFPEFGNREIKDEGKKLYKLYSALTHASGYAQIQCGLADKEFDCYMTNWTVDQVAFLVDIHLFILDQYIDKMKESIQPHLSESEITDKTLIAASMMCRDAMDQQSQIAMYHKEIAHFMDGIEANPVWLFFIDKWNMKEKKYHGQTII